MPTSQFDILTKKARPKAKEEKAREWGIIIGLGCTLLLHVVLILVAPYIPLGDITGRAGKLPSLADKKAKSFDFELAPLPPEPPKQDPFKFVETNPDAPANEPDKTNNFSNRNQQSAQKEAAKELDPENRPSIKGRTDLKNDSEIVTGDHAQPQQGAAATPNTAKTTAEQQKQQQARAEQIPLSGFEKSENKSAEGIASNVAKNLAPSNDASELVEGAKDAKNTDGGVISINQTNKPTPKPRPRLTAQRSTVLADRAPGTNNVGVVGIDARWSEYGEYMQELIEIVDTTWHGILAESNLHYKANTHVNVTFTINTKGEVKVTSVENFADDVAVSQCESAITNQAPYRKWTDQMIAVLGQEQSITFSFYYY